MLLRKSVSKRILSGNTEILIFNFDHQIKKKFTIAKKLQI